MADRVIRRALIAVYDKTGIVEFARALVDEFGIEIISTGGTARHLKEAGIPVTMVEQVTGFPEMLDGRVKTLHPKIHAAILADRDNPEHMRQLAEQSITPIDMVVVNLYPFEKTVADPNCTFEQAIEMIDIGGPCMLRAAAKNHKDVLIETDSAAFSYLLDRFRDEGKAVASVDERRRKAKRTFDLVAQYDIDVTEWFYDQVGEWPRRHCLSLMDWGDIKYGENPHQEAGLLERGAYGQSGSLVFAEVSHINADNEQPKISFNNYVDADAALGLCAELTRTKEKKWRQLSVSATKNQISVVAFIKHTNACGVGIAEDSVEAYRQAYLGDPNAAMGGILAVSFPVDATFAEVIMETLQRFKGEAERAGCKSVPQAFFLEVLVAPSFDEDAVEVIRSRKKWGANVRLLTVGDMNVAPNADLYDYKSIAGGMLVQSRDLVGLNEDQWKVVTQRAPTDKEMANFRLAWLIAKHTKSNAISLCKDGMLIGNGAGQMSRVMSCRIATWLARENGHADKLAGSVAASDAFFPFRDGPDLLMEAGITAIIQPGGSKRDEDTIAACNERGIAMIFTGTRHFKH